MKEKIPTTSTRMNMSSSSLSNMIVNTDEYESILAWNGMEQKHYSVCHRRRGYEITRNNPSASLFFKNGNADKLSTWCRNVIEHFHLPRYLEEWTMNFVHRYVTSQSVRTADAAYKALDTHMLKMMTAVALRLCIRLDAGQSIYSRQSHEKNSPTSVNVDHHQQQHHIDAMTTIPYLVSKADDKPMTLECLNQMFFKLEIVLMKSLGFYLHPPLTEHYLEEIHKIVENMMLSDMERNLSLKINKSYTVLLLQQLKTKAVILGQSACSLWQSNCSFENDDDEIIITPSACSVAVCSYLAALHLSAITYYNRDITVAECCKELYKILLDAFLDVIVREPSLPKEKKLETIEGMVEALVLSSETASCCFGIKDHGQHKKDVTPRLSQEESNINHTHHQRHAAAAVAITASPIQLGKRKASPTSVIMLTKQDDDDCKNDDRSVPITSPMKKVSLNHRD